MIRLRVWKSVVVLILLVLLMTSSLAKTGYDIRVNGDGTSWGISRSTQQASFSMDETIIGDGNFSRLTHLKGFTGIKADESSTSTRGGSLDLNEKLLLVSAEGPVAFNYNLISINITDMENITINTGSAEINIDEVWPVYFANYKKINYLGPAIRTAERYENNGDIFASSIDSRKLTKQSIYSTQQNRTLIHAIITPGRVLEMRNSNKSSNYAIDMQTIGSLAHLEIVKADASGRLISEISEDFKGYAKIGLHSNMSDSVYPPTIDDEWIPCCTSGYFNMRESDYKNSCMELLCSPESISHLLRFHFV